MLLVGDGSDESPPAAVSPATPKEVAQQWVEAINAGKIKEAASLFAIPSETNAPSGEPITIDTLGEAFQVMDALGCGGEIVDLTAFDEVVTVTRRLESRPGSVCRPQDVGDVERIQITARDGQIVSWQYI